MKIKKCPAYLLVASLLASVACSAAEIPQIHPRPQSLKMAEGTLNLRDGITLIKGAKQDNNTLKILGEMLQQAGVPASANGPIQLRIALASDSVLNGAGKGLEERSGAYRLLIAPDDITLAGYDAQGLFYAVQTLSQILEAGPQLPYLKIDDFPDLPFRGTVEGFYGKPWSHQDRLSQLAFYGKYKLNTYIYGPKDDPYHSSPNWREPYPTNEAKQIHELTTAAQQNQVDFYWAIHPGKDIQWNEADDRALLKKFEAMYTLGVRAFAVFFDDISGQGTDPKMQAALLNRIHNEFIQIKGDVRPLIMCPTQYNKAWSGGSYLDILGDDLDPSIHVMWTGNSVVADITRDTMEWINRPLKRKAFIWWNFPVSDYVRDHLLLGAAYGLDPNAGEQIAGFVSNPMDKPEASKLALYGVADYGWNSKKYDAEQAWVDGIKALMPTAAEEAYAVFARHNADTGPSYHNYRRVESVEMAPITETFLAHYDSGGEISPSLTALTEEFIAIQKAPAVIRQYAGNPALIEEIDPWLIQFEQLGDVGVAALQTVTHLQRNHIPEAWNSIVATQQALDKMLVTDKTLNQNPYQPGVKTGSLVLTPFVKKLVQLNGTLLYSQASGRPLSPTRPFVSFPSDAGIEKMVDGDVTTFYESRAIQKVGDFVGIDLGSVTEINAVAILMGENNDDYDRINKGQLEASIDHKNWKPLGGETTGAEVEYRGKGTQARYVRYRVTRAGKLDGSKNDVWTRVRCFEVNPILGPTLKTNHEALSKLSLQIDGGTIGLSPVFEVLSFKTGQFVGLDFGEAIEISTVTLDLNVNRPETCGELQFSLDNQKWTPLPAKTNGSVLTATPQRKARYLRFINTTAKNQEIYLNRFVAETKSNLQITSGAFNDQNVSTALSGPIHALKIRNEEPKADGIVLLLSGEANVNVVAYDAQGKPNELGKTTQPCQIFSFKGLKLPIQGIVLSDAQGRGQLHEVIWHTAP